MINISKKIVYLKVLFFSISLFGFEDNRAAFDNIKEMLSFSSLKENCKNKLKKMSKYFNNKEDAIFSDNQNEQSSNKNVASNLEKVEIYSIHAKKDSRCLNGGYIKVPKDEVIENFKAEESIIKSGENSLVPFMFGFTLSCFIYSVICNIYKKSKTSDFNTNK